MTSRIVGNSGTASFAYAGQNRLASASYPGAATPVTKTWTATNRLSTATGRVML